MKRTTNLERDTGKDAHHEEQEGILRNPPNILQALEDNVSS
jgi:hypothetical protein